MRPAFIDDLRRRLREQGVGRRYISRLSAELLDHFDALKAELTRGGMDDAEAERQAEQQLGDPEELVREVLRRQKLGRFVRTHPFVVFALSPLPLTLIVALMFALLGTGAYLFLVRVVEISSTDPVLRFAFHYGFYAVAYGLTPLLALGYCRLASRHRCALWMAAVSSVLLCGAGGFLEVHFVQCLHSGSAKFFQWWGLDAARLLAPLGVFSAYAGQRLVREQLTRRALL